MKASIEADPGRRMLLVALAVVSLASCAEAHQGTPADGGLRDSGPMDLGRDSSSPCSDRSARAEPISLSASSGDDPLAVTRACTSATGWGDCDGGTVSVELLDANDTPMGSVELTFEDDGGTVLPRDCRLLRPGDPLSPIPCSYVGRFDLSGDCDGGAGSYPRLCGQLAVEVEGDALEATIALDAWSVGFCF